MLYCKCDPDKGMLILSYLYNDVLCGILLKSVSKSYGMFLLTNFG